MLAVQSLRDPPDAGNPTTEEVQSYLRELLAREDFSASERNRRFLSYVVRETLDGRADRIKAYNIALAAFDRTKDFDPLTDPIVRIEAGRLRRSLEHYYLTTGQADRIRIGIPKGSYAATFTYREQRAAASSHLSASTDVSLRSPRHVSAVSYHFVKLASLWAVLGIFVGSLATYGIANHVQATSKAIATKPSLVIVPFEDTGGDPRRAFIARALTYNVGIALTQLDDVAVFGLGPAMDTYVSNAELIGDFALMGSVETGQHSMRVAVFLVDSRTRQFLQSWSFQKDLVTNDIMTAQAEVAQQILVSLRKQCTHESMDRATALVQNRFDCRPVTVAAK
jgi:adenylate cyclase